MMKAFFIIALLCGSTAIMLDAFFAHGLENFLGDNFSDTVFHALSTGARYQLTAAILLLTLTFVYRIFNTKWIIVSQSLLVVGMLFFCGGIYAKYLLNLHNLARVAPLGGIAFMLSFLALIPLVVAIN